MCRIHLHPNIISNLLMFLFFTAPKEKQKQRDKEIKSRAGPSDEGAGDGPETGAGAGARPKQPPGPKRRGKQLDLAVELERARELWTQSSQIPGNSSALFPFHFLTLFSLSLFCFSNPHCDLLMISIMHSQRQ